MQPMVADVGCEWHLYIQKCLMVRLLAFVLGLERLGLIVFGVNIVLDVLLVVVIVVVLDGYVFGFALVLLLVPAAALARVVGVGVAGVDGDGRGVHSFAVETFEPSEGEFLL